MREYDRDFPDIWMFWVSGCVVQILSWLGGRWGEVHSHHCVQDRLGSTLNNLTNGTGLGLGFVATRNKQHVHHVACTFSWNAGNCPATIRYQYHLASSAERIRLSLRKTSKGPAPMAMCSLISFGLCMVYVWAMHGLCQLHGMKEKQIRERERERARESAIPYQKQMFLSIVQHLHCCQDWLVPCSGTPCCLRQPHLQFIPPRQI